MYESIEDLLPDNKPKKNKKDLLDEIRFMEDENPTNIYNNFLPSSLLKEKEEKKNEKEKEESTDIDDWLQQIEILTCKPSKKASKKGLDDIFEAAGLKKKKKKKKDKDKNGLVNYKEVFAPEQDLYKNLLVDQSKFVNDLQKNYDQINAYKSTNRGITKQMTDLIENITDARSLQMQLIDKSANIKKLIADLDIKQKKEFGGGEIGDNMSDFASHYLKQMMSERQNFANIGDSEVVDLDSDEAMEELINNIGEVDLDNDGDKFLEYENKNIKIYVSVPKLPNGDIDIDRYEFIAKDDDGNIVDDYPLPLHTRITVNTSTGIAVDSYGEKYSVIFTD